MRLDHLTVRWVDVLQCWARLSFISFVRLTTTIIWWTRARRCEVGTLIWWRKTSFCSFRSIVFLSIYARRRWRGVNFFLREARLHELILRPCRDCSNPCPLHLETAVLLVGHPGDDQRSHSIQSRIDLSWYRSASFESDGSEVNYSVGGENVWLHATICFRLTWCWRRTKLFPCSL